MTHEEKERLWKQYPEIWTLFEEFNGILQEDADAWCRLVKRAEDIKERYKLPIVEQLLIETVGELDKISKRRC